MGISYFLRKSLVYALLPSSRAPARPDHKPRSLLHSRASTAPLHRGTSGPTTTKSAPCSLANRTISELSSIFRAKCLEFLGHAPVARCDHYFFHAITSRTDFGQGMFATTASQKREFSNSYHSIAIDFPQKLTGVEAIPLNCGYLDNFWFPFIRDLFKDV